MRTYVSIAGDRWATEEELRAIGAKHTFGHTEEDTVGGGPLLCWTGKDAVVLPIKHTAILGGTGAGKTQSVLLPALLSSIDQGESCIVNDPKGGELYRYSAEYAREQGYKVIVLNFSSPDQSARWNCFSLVNDCWKRGDRFLSDQYLADVSQMIYERHIRDAKDPFWGEAASQYFCGLAQVARKAGYPLTLETILKLHTDGEKRSGIKTVLDKWLELFDADNLIRQNISATIDAPKDTRLSIDAVFHAPLNNYCQPGLHKMMSSSSFDYSELYTEKCIVYLVTPPVRSNFDALVSLFIKQAISVLTEGEPLPRPVTFFLEEFASFPRITDFDLAISMARSYNIRFFICAQNSEQLRARYGDNSDIIINNCGCIYALRNKDRKFYEQYIQPLCGAKILPHSERSYPLISFSDIQHFRCGQALILVDGLYPFVTQLPQVGGLGIHLRESSLNSVPRSVDDAPIKTFDFENDVKEESRRRTSQLMKRVQEDAERLKQEEIIEQERFGARKNAATEGTSATQITSGFDPESIDYDAFQEALIFFGLDEDESDDSKIKESCERARELPGRIGKMSFYEWLNQGGQDALNRAKTSKEAKIVSEQPSSIETNANGESPSA